MSKLRNSPTPGSKTLVKFNNKARQWTHPETHPFLSLSVRTTYLPKCNLNEDKMIKAYCMPSEFSLTPVT
jgi:hypothetical protein